MRRWVVLGVLIGVAALAAAEPDPIHQAIGRLGDRRFTAREQASQALFAAGTAAEAALRQAANSPDPEVARRARRILDDFDWGIYPTTPPAVAELIGRYRAAQTGEKRAVVEELLKLGRPGSVALGRIVRRERAAEDRRELLTALTHGPQAAIPSLLAEGDLATVQDILEACVGDDPDAARGGHAADTASVPDDPAVHFAFFVSLRGTLGPAIARFERVRAAGTDPGDPEAVPGAAARRAAQVLTALYRAKGDLAAARRAAGQSGRSDLLEAVLWEQGDWKELAARRAMPPGLFAGPAATLGLQAAYERLAGDTDALAKTVEELRKFGEHAVDGPETARMAAESLLLNERPGEALGVLATRNVAPDLAFEVLVAQFRHAEALELAEKARGLSVGSQRLLDARKARLLYLLGEREAALAWYARYVEEARGWSFIDSKTAKEVVRSLKRLGLNDLALEHGARLLASSWIAADAPLSGNADVFEIFFGKRSAAAERWWHYLRQRAPKDDPVGTLRRMLALLEPAPRSDPTAEAEAFARYADTLAPAERGGCLEAVAEAFRAAGRDDAALAYIEKAAQGAEKPELPQRLGDFLMDRRRYRPAAQAYERSWNLDRSRPLPLYLRGLALARAGDEAEGKRLMDQSHWLPLGDEVVRTTFAEELTKRGQAEAAARERDLVLRCGWYRSWQVGNLLNMQARAALARKDYGTAADAYERAVVGCLRSGARYVEPAGYVVMPAAVHSNRARGLAAAGKPAEALREAERALEASPGNSELVGDLIAEFDRQGHRREADALFDRLFVRLEKLSRDYPKSAFAHNACAWLGASARRRLDGALEHARRAAELEPKNAGYLDTLAEVHFRRGERDQALAAMRQCLELTPNRDYFRKQLQRFQTGDIASDPPVGDDD
jgi:tetratricopeptide (TPR) repeat protein